jgi:streptogramin lyase
MKPEKYIIIFIICLLSLLNFSNVVTAVNGGIENMDAEISPVIGGGLSEEETGIAIEESILIFPQIDNVIFSFAGPDSAAAGLTWDGTHLWLADIFSGKIYKIDPSDGSVLLSFVAPADYPTGLAWDGSNLWVVCEQNATAYKLDPQNGSVISSIQLPSFGEDDPNAACITWDGEYIWHTDYTHDMIYQLNASNGSVISSFASPGSNPSGLAFDGEYLWHSDTGSDRIYRIDPFNGTVVSSFASSASHPWDLAWDGTYLWNADPADNIVYKIDVAESPPAISIKTNSFRYFPGDTMTVTLSFANITDENAIFQLYWGSIYNNWTPLMTSPVMAGYDFSFALSFTIPDFGPMPFGNVFSVYLLDERSEVLEAAAVSWAYSPGDNETLASDADKADTLKWMVRDIIISQ